MELQMGYCYGATSEQEQYTVCDISGKRDTFSRVLQTYRYFSWCAYSKIKSWHDRRRSSFKLSTFNVQKEQETTYAKVYDLVNCGKRNRFLVRNKNGQVLVSHNSGGHGLNLQSGGCTDVAWFSIPFDLELYEQANARVYRQGVSGSVTIHHIVAKNTVDYHILEVLGKKSTMQQALLEAIKK